MGAQLLQSGPTLWDLMGGSPPGSYVLGILQARILERVVMPFSSGSSQPEDPTRICLPPPALQADFLSPEPPGKTLVSLQYPTPHLARLSSMVLEKNHAT